MDEGGERIVGQLLGAVAQHSLERRIRLDDPAREVDPGDADRRPIEDGSESFLTLAQRPLNLFAFGDVQEAGNHLEGLAVRTHHRDGVDQNPSLAAIGQYMVAARQAEALRREAEAVIVRTRPVVLALGTGPGATRAGTSLARAESLFNTMDYPLAKIAALDAEQAGLIAGVAPPSPQPTDPRAAIDVLLRVERMMENATRALVDAPTAPATPPQRGAALPTGTVASAENGAGGN